MNTRRAIAWKTLGALAALALIPASLWAFGGPLGGGRMGPPQEAIDACAGKKAGDAVRFTTPCGDNVSAFCAETRAGLAAAPGRVVRGPGMGRGPGRHFDRMASALELTSDQKAQIRSILDAEREKTAPLREQLMENRAKMRQLAQATPYDETSVRKLAASQEQARVELVVSRTRAMSQVFALLTPEQREKAKAFGPFREGGPGHGPRW